MRTTYCLPGARRRGFSLVAGLALLCLAGTIVGSSPARAAEAPPAESELLTTGEGYAQPQGSTRVRALQRRLRTLGLRPGSVDGLFGPETEAAVASFQRALGLQVDGIVGPDTRRALRRATGPMLGRGAGYDRRGGSIRVMTLQRHLRSMGLRPGPIDGLYGPLTAAAVARFQRAQGTRVDGVAWPRTRRAIGNARAGAGTRVAGDGRTTTSRLVDVRAPSRQALDGTKARRSIRHAALDTGERPARIEEATDAGLIVLSGLLVFMLIAVAAPVARRVVMAPASATAGGAVTPPADDPGPSPASAEPPLLPTAADHDTEPNWREADGRAVNAVGYLTAPDPTRGHVELRHQLTAMDALCERSGWRLVEVARDVGDISGEALERPGLNYALERLAANDRPCLMVAELRRLGGSAAELGRVLRWLRERGLRLIAVDVQLDTAAAEGRIAADALISVGARAEQGARTRRTEEEVRDPRPGRPAVRDLPELREHIVAMRSAGMTLQAIADRLNEEGVPTMRGGREWRPSSVQVAAGYRRPRRLSSRRNAYDNRSAQRRRLEDR